MNNNSNKSLVSEEKNLLTIARVVHESVRAINQAHGDDSLQAWDDAEEWQRQSTLDAVRAIASDPDLTSEGEHARWMEDKMAQGWKYGSVRNDSQKVHPLLVPYDQLPLAAQQKNAVIVAVVRAMLERAEDVVLLRIAMAVHEMNRAWCEINGDYSQAPWAESPEWQRKASISGIKYIMEHPDIAPGFQHVQWVNDKLADGWKYGPIKDAEKKEHPMLIPFEQLPWEEQVKDAIFVTTAKMLLKIENRSFLTGPE
jgi:hypothetical protein